MENVKRSPQS